MSKISWRVITSPSNDGSYGVEDSGTGEVIALTGTYENACLISAAPSLLNALRQALIWIKATEEDINHGSPLIKQLEIAIKQAESGEVA